MSNTKIWLIIRILLTPIMFLIALFITGLGLLYFRVLVRMYKFAWDGWDN